jgi:threonine synthase
MSQILYHSTRDSLKRESITSSAAIKQGLAADGGLFVPDSLPTIGKADVEALLPLSYSERAAKILSMFLTDYTSEELLEDCRNAYSESSFPGGAAPLRAIDENTVSLELWHGPTAAFKDMALQIMPRLLSRALVKTGETRTALILVATSGDTGKAALEGYKDIPQIKMMVFYPIDGVSRVQKLQMATQTGNNVSVKAIRGNFDDAQTGVKIIFGDEEAASVLNENGCFFSSANSINWGRLAPQIVYYVSAYCDLLKAGKLSYGDPMNVCVPTGNFGNILAAYIAKMMGLPVGKLICASNSNNVLTEFLETGTYNRNRPFHLTMSPSMDILISSNLERLLYFVAGSDATRSYMESLNKNGSYTVSSDVFDTIRKDFYGYYADEAATAETIRATFRENGYLIDTHTAVAVSAVQQYREKTGDQTVTVVASTASPYKFAADVYASLTEKAASDPLAALDELSAVSNTEIPYPLKGIATRTVRFTDVIDKNEMKETVYQFAKQSE